MFSPSHKMPIKHRETLPITSNTHMHELDVDGHGLVAMHEFGLLTGSCTSTLEKEFNALNEDMTKVSELLK